MLKQGGRQRRGTKQAALATIVAALLLVSCGGTEEMSAPLTKTEYIKQGNAICQKNLKENEKALAEALKQLSAKKISPSSRKGAEDLTSAALPPLTALTQQLADLTPPPKDEKTASQMVEQFESGLTKMEEDPLGAFKSNSFQPAGETARQYGLTACTI
jgi:hypothetical protein